MVANNFLTCNHGFASYRWQLTNSSPVTMDLPVAKPRLLPTRNDTAPRRLSSTLWTTKLLMPTVSFHWFLSSNGPLERSRGSFNDGTDHQIRAGWVTAKVKLIVTSRPRCPSKANVKFGLKILGLAEEKRQNSLTSELENGCCKQVQWQMIAANNFNDIRSM